MTSLCAWVHGLGLWARTDVPPCAIVPSRLGRGTSRITRMIVDCASQAIDEAGFDGAQVAAVTGSAYGELQIAIEQLDMMLAGDGVVSPARFKNSVHNTAAGILSIATKNTGFTTAIAAGDHTVAASLFEGMLVLEANLAQQVVVSVADEAPPEPLRSANDGIADFEPVGAAFALSKDPAGALCNLELTLNQAGEALDVAPELAKNPCAVAARLAVRVRERRTGWWLLSEESQRWSAKIEVA